jgi:hypothetical protein
MAKNENNGYKYFNFALSFGLTLAITAYLLYKGGEWLDSRFGTAPLFMCLGILLAIVTVFKQLIEDINKMNKE